MTTPILDIPTQNMDNRSAQALLKDTLHNWGLDDLYQNALDLIKSGLDQTAILLQLQDSDAYKKRFAANQIRAEKGLPVLSPAEYIATERAYQDVLRMYGMPEGFYDQHEDFTNWIASDVSPDEMQQRVEAAAQVWMGTDEAVKREYRQFYGLSDSAAIAAMLDPEKAVPIVQRQVTAAQIGAAAQRNQLELSVQRAEYFAGLGISQQDAVQAYSKIGGRIQTESAEAQRFGTTLTQEEQENSEFLGLASANRKRQRLNASEGGLFQGRASDTGSSLAQSTTGQF